MVASTLRQLASQGRTVICTIHQARAPRTLWWRLWVDGNRGLRSQPRMSTLAKFDKIMLLGAGRVCYFGPTAPHCLVWTARCRVSPKGKRVVHARCAGFLSRVWLRVSAVRKRCRLDARPGLCLLAARGACKREGTFLALTARGRSTPVTIRCQSSEQPLLCRR
jgi:hypothetical protein